MQAQQVIPSAVVYHRDMAGRPTTKEAPIFGQRLAALRQSRAWTQAELADKLGTTVKMVTYYEREAENPTRKTIESIAEVFGVSTAELVGEITKPSRSSKPGPPSQLQQLMHRLATLPKAKQKVVIDMLEGVLQKA